MFDSQQIGMQGLSAKGFERGSGRGREVIRLGLEPGSVDVVAEQGVADRGKVDADLMGAASLQPAGQEARDWLAVGATIPLKGFPVRDRLAAALADRHLVAGAGVAVDRLVDGATRPLGGAPDERQITAPQRPG